MFYSQVNSPNQINKIMDAEALDGLYHPGFPPEVCSKIIYKVLTSG